MRRLGVLLVVAGVFVAGFALAALADHVSDGGVDQPWVNEMNQEAYWESLWGAECTKFENHSGFIPAQYDAAVVKDGNMVRIYNPAPTPFTALGAVNPANDKHFGAPHSWVMKCKTNTTTTTIEEPTTTTTEATTSTLESTTTTSTTVGSSSTTSTPTSSTSSSTTPSTVQISSSTTTTTPNESTTTAPTTSAPTPPDDPDSPVSELPYTGVPTGVLAGIAGILVALGGLVLRAVSHPERNP